MIKNKFLKVASILSSIVASHTVRVSALNTYFENYYLKLNKQDNKYDLSISGRDSRGYNNSQTDKSVSDKDPAVSTNKSDYRDYDNSQTDKSVSDKDPAVSTNQSDCKEYDNSKTDKGISDKDPANSTVNSSTQTNFEQNNESVNIVTHGLNCNRVDNSNINKVNENLTRKNSVLGSDFDLNKHMRGASGNKLLNGKSWLDFIFRAKYLPRWHILNSNEKESLTDHLFETGVVAHSLALIKNNMFGGNLNPDRAMTLGVFHDILELFTGDMPTTTKYIIPEMKKVYSEVEDLSKSKFLDLVPIGLKESFSLILAMDGKNEPEWEIVKEADIIVAYIKSVRECSRGNSDYEGPLKLLESQLENLSAAHPEICYFLYDILPSFYPSSSCC